MTPTLREQIEAALKTAAKATAGPWKIGYDDGSGQYDSEQEKFCLVSEPVELKNGESVGDVSYGSILHAKLCENGSDADHIATMDPTFTRQVLESWLVMERALELIAKPDLCATDTEPPFMFRSEIAEKSLRVARGEK